MGLRASLALAVAALLAIPASANCDKPRAEDAALSFIDQLVANLTELSAEKDQSCAQEGSRTVDLGYAKYEGYHDEDADLNIWKGIRFADPPTGELRWQPPRMPGGDPEANTTQATEFGPICPQNLPSAPGAPFIPGEEDCLFLNVYAPPEAENLPVLVWIHGGGYGFGDGTQDMAGIVNDNEQRFIAVSIQYRLSAFGFLASPDVKSDGVVNAGLLDQALAIAWVKLFICQFGGDPSRITISGESAGASSVMYHGLAVDGGFGTLLFDNVIAASPYLPFQYDYEAEFPVSTYNALAEEVGCAGEDNVLGCLRGVESMALQEASHAVTQTQTSGFWAYYPVTDGAYITALATAQLSQKKVNGRNLLVGNNANEGPLFVPPTIVTEADLTEWLALQLPTLPEDLIQDVLDANPNSEETDPEGPRFATNGLDGATALEVSQDSNGQQQRAANILAESTFVCPSYWMADAWSGKGRKSWHFQYSVPFASHQADVGVYFGPVPENIGADMSLAFRRIWGNFITGDDPSISDGIANGAASEEPEAPNGVSSWPVWKPDSPQQVNLNQTGGEPYEFTTQWGTVVTQFREPGLLNAIGVVPADTWEGGRGERCAFWKGLAPDIPY